MFVFNVLYFWSCFSYWKFIFEDILFALKSRMGKKKRHRWFI
uniref:Uncharacterized protein n=1 Tax=Rhizophora mucronata TaxID=61149 RepID=A0A2P2Q425_RHIMU